MELIRGIPADLLTAGHGADTIIHDFRHLYDARGNVTNDGRYTLAGVYPRAGLRPDPGDLTDQPVAISGSGVSATYKYDGNKKRIKSVVGGAETFPILFGVR